MENYQISTITIPGDYMPEFDCYADDNIIEFAPLEKVIFDDEE